MEETKSTELSMHESFTLTKYYLIFESMDRETLLNVSKSLLLQYVQTQSTVKKLMAKQLRVDTEETFDKSKLELFSKLDNFSN